MYIISGRPQVNVMYVTTTLNIFHYTYLQNVIIKLQLFNIKIMNYITHYKSKKLERQFHYSLNMGFELKVAFYYPEKESWVLLTLVNISILSF